MSCYVFDLDGTLSCGKHRLNLLPTEETRNRTEAWDAFNLAAGDDAPILDNVELLQDLHQNNTVIILTGRSFVAHDITKAWLDKHQIPYDQLIMRPRDDHRKDIEFKTEKLRYIDKVYGKIIACFDDLEHVVKHIRSLGITCHQVTHYDQPLVHERPRKAAV